MLWMGVMRHRIRSRGLRFGRGLGAAEAERCGICGETQFSEPCAVVARHGRKGLI